MVLKALYACLPTTGTKCESVADACFSQPCFNNGTCSYRGLCSCPDVIARCGWHDDTCQRDVCSNRLDCRVYSTPFTCDCSHTGFTGPQCADDINECLQVDACLNGGVCHNTLGGYTCSCQGTGYQGDRCEKNVDECVVDPTVCFNGGESLSTFLIGRMFVREPSLEYSSNCDEGVFGVQKASLIMF